MSLHDCQLNLLSLLGCIRPRDQPLLQGDAVVEPLLGGMALVWVGVNHCLPIALLKCLAPYSCVSRHCSPIMKTVTTMERLR